MVHDIFFMRLAIEQALKAQSENEVPIGAIIVKNNEVIAAAYNQVEQKNTQCAHAEMQALMQLKEKNWRLADCSVYVTVQPCMMCMGALLLSRVERIVYGASSPVYGLNLEVFDIPAVYKNSTKIYGGVLNEEIQGIMKVFFNKKRVEKK